jgi:hypothetical protein
MGWFSKAKPQPEPAQPGPGVRHDRVREALAGWAEQKDARTVADVLRRTLVGELLLDATGSTLTTRDGRLQPGATLQINSTHDQAGKHLLLAFTGHDELSRLREEPGQSLVQPAAAVLAQAARDYDGIVIDGRSPGAFIAYAPEIGQHLTDDPEARTPLSTALVERTLPTPDLLALLAAATLYVLPVVRVHEDGTEVATLATTRGPDGSVFAVIGSAPAELWAWSPGGMVRGTDLAHVARIVQEDGFAGIVLNPAKPDVVLPVEVLARFA